MVSDQRPDRFGVGQGCMSSDEAFVEEVLAALGDCGSEAIVVGSVAALLQGVPVATEDEPGKPRGS